MKEENPIFTVNDFFCGCGGMGLGFKNAGFQILGAWDFDKYAVQSYKENVGEYVKQHDVQKMSYAELPHSSIWAFGFPCQDLSLAGKKKGLFEGKKSGLFFEIMRLLEETRQNCPDSLPNILVAENVKGLKPFLNVLEEEYNKQGYNTYTQVLNSKNFGVPQNRERYFIIGIKKEIDNGSFSFPVENKANIPKLYEILEPHVDEKYFIPPEKSKTILEQVVQNYKETHHEGEIIKVADFPREVINDNERQRRVYSPEGISPTILARADGPKIVTIGQLDMKAGKQIKSVYDPKGISPTVDTCQGGYRQVKILDQKELRVRKLTPYEYGMLQGFPMKRWKQIVSDSQAYKQFGNAVTVNVSEAVAHQIKTFLTHLKKD